MKYSKFILFCLIIDAVVSFVLFLSTYYISGIYNEYFEKLSTNIIYFIFSLIFQYNIFIGYCMTNESNLLFRSSGIIGILIGIIASFSIKRLLVINIEMTINILSVFLYNKYFKTVIIKQYIIPICILLIISLVIDTIITMKILYNWINEKITIFCRKRIVRNEEHYEDV